jgi:hypothetical protein
LLANGVKPQALFGASVHPSGPDANLAAFDTYAPESPVLTQWALSLRRFGVFFCEPLDLDYSMLKAFPAAYQSPEPGRSGPSPRGDPRVAVLGDDGLPGLYSTEHDDLLRWYRYLFLGRGKPSTHVRVLGGLSTEVLSQGAPPELRALLSVVRQGLQRADGGA